jgi:hypothetical protein
MRLLYQPMFIHYYLVDYYSLLLEFWAKRGKLSFPHHLDPEAVNQGYLKRERFSVFGEC